MECDVAIALAYAVKTVELGAISADTDSIILGFLVYQLELTEEQICRAEAAFLCGTQLQLSPADLIEHIDALLVHRNLHPPTLLGVSSQVAGIVLRRLLDGPCDSRSKALLKGIHIDPQGSVVVDEVTETSHPKRA